MAVDPQIEQKDEVLTNGHVEVVAKTVENGIQVNGVDGREEPQVNGESKDNTKAESKDEAKDKAKEEKKEDAAEGTKEKTKTKPVVRYDE